MTSLSTASWDEVLDAVVEESLRVRYAWGNYRYLFEHHVDVLNATASDFFRWVQGLAADAVFMGIARLTDPGVTRARDTNQENASLHRLLSATQWQTRDPILWKRFSDLLATVKESCESCRHYRHKRIGHFDLAIALNVEPVPIVTVREVDAALESIEHFLGDIHLELRPGHSQLVLIDGEAHAKRLTDKLTNRMSRIRPDATSTIVRSDGEPGTSLLCGYCDQSARVYMVSDDVPEGRFLKLWHFNKCPGVVGVETVTVEMINRAGEPLRRTFALNDPR